ncbi:ribonuclease III [Thermodesulfobacteriota bacterium]
METRNLPKLEQQLQYTFKNRNLLNEALNHSSYVNEQSNPEIRDNERLEFLGDAVLNLVVGHILMQDFPNLKEGDLSRIRASLVNESRLADFARKVDLGAFIRLGKGEIQTNGQEKQSILANTYEAMIAAVYLDGGFDAAFRLIRTSCSSALETVSESEESLDYKSQLQEIVQITRKVTPKYRVVEESGPDHDKTFRVEAQVAQTIAEGIGKSKKTAEQEAARKILDIIKSA